MSTYTSREKIANAVLEVLFNLPTKSLEGWTNHSSLEGFCWAYRRAQPDTATLRYSHITERAAVAIFSSYKGTLAFHDFTHSEARVVRDTCKKLNEQHMTGMLGKLPIARKMLARLRGTDTSEIPEGGE